MWGLHKKLRIAVYSLFSTLLVLKLEHVLLMKMLLFSAQRQEEEKRRKNCRRLNFVLRMKIVLQKI